ncbi:hypothetical protein FF38_02435 [Lucilia cuprina]|uniref:DUF4794 domain-containing protein n=1 Tax=Lucilia cuprina TaxID=7375 RepID=A0A0L0CAH9_LUCCU|nr:hypothetical protein FF38_02435 [Lucilia cuprina]
MFKKVITILIFLFVGIINGLPPGVKPTENKKSHNEGPFIQPEVITIERLEALLRKASEIFKPTNLQRSDAPTAEIQQVAVPIQFMQPPANQPFNFYLPLFDYDESDAQHTKLDEKSRKMEHFTPPPLPKEGESQENFYDVKPKKALPKKFNSSAKHINIKWLNAYEKQLSSPSNKQSVNVPKDVYLINDERNRINFDDTFFAVDMKVPDRTNKLDKSATEIENQNDDYNSQGEEDLIAAAALQIPLITQFTNLRRF